MKTVCSPRVGSSLLLLVLCVGLSGCANRSSSLRSQFGHRAAVERELIASHGESALERYRTDVAEGSSTRTAQVAEHLPTYRTASAKSCGST